MKFIPFDRFTLSVSGDSAGINALLAPQIGTPPKIEFHFGPFGSKPQVKFYGTLTPTEFKIWHAIRYRNSFRPIITGTYEPHPIGTKIEVIQRLSYFVMIFAFFWMSMVLTITGSLTVASGMPDEQVFGINILTLLPFIMLAGFYILTVGGFWWEARRTKEQFMGILAPILIPEPYGTFSN